MHVLISIPTLGWICSDLFIRLQQILMHGQEKGIICGLNIVRAIPHDNARNHLANNLLLDKNFDWMLSIDSDVVPPANILDMLSDERPICAAYCNGLLPINHSRPLSERIGPVAIDYFPDSNQSGGIGYQQYPIKPGELKEVPSFGTGCYAARRDVFETIPQPHFRFGYDEKGLMILGEDLFFCQKAKEYGYKLYMDGNFVCEHKKEIFI